MQSADVSARTVPALLDFAQARYGPHDAFRWREGEEIRSVTYARFAWETRALAAALEAKTVPGAKIAIVGENAYHWLLCWFAALCAGRVAVPLDPQLPAADILALLEKSGATLLFYAAGFEKAASAFGRAIYMKVVPAMLAPYRGTAGWPCEARPDDLAAIVYTSGTTGESKGVMLSHWNFMSNALSGCRHMHFTAHETLVVLPFHHTISITPGVLAQLSIGSTLGICKGVKSFNRDLVALRPESMLVVPLLAQGMYNKIWDTAKKEGKEKLLRILLAVSGALLRVGIDLRRRLFKRVIGAFGGRLDWMMCGGAAIPEECVHGFHRFGIDLLPVYGTTECAPGVALNRRGACRAQSVGQIMDCNDVRIDADGEILVKGGNVFMGYYEDEQATREAFTPDGWYKTGDLGRMDEDGYLYITGRKKNLIILSNGKNVSAEGLEQKLMELPCIREALVYQEGDEIAAELFLDEETPAARLEAELLALNRRLPAYQRITKTVLRDTEFPKTTTKKIKRR